MLEKIEKRIGSMKNGGFLIGGMIASVVLTIVFCILYQNHINNGEGIFYTMFPNQMQNVYVEQFSFAPFIISCALTCIWFFIYATAEDVQTIVDAGKGKAIVGSILPNIILFIAFWLICLLFDKLNLSVGLFSCYGYMNFLTIIVGVVFAVLNMVVFSVCKVMGHKL